MYKLCLAVAFLAVAAAKPNWPLTYSLPAGFPSYAAYAPGAAVYSPPAYQLPSTLPLIAKTIPGHVGAPAVASAYSFTGPSPAVVNPVVTAPAAPLVTPLTYSVPSNYYTALAPPAASVGFPPLSGYAYGNSFAWKK